MCVRVCKGVCVCVVRASVCVCVCARAHTGVCARERMCARVCAYV